MPRSASDVGAVAVEGRRSTPSTCPDSRALGARESAALAPFALSAPPRDAVGAVAPLCEVHGEPKSVVGLVPADPFATRHADPEGRPAALFRSEPFAAKSSDAEDGWVPQLVPRLASVGTPGDASAVEQVEAYVGS